MSDNNERNENQGRVNESSYKSEFSSSPVAFFDKDDLITDVFAYPSHWERNGFSNKEVVRVWLEKSFFSVEYRFSRDLDKVFRRISEQDLNHSFKDGWVEFNSNDQSIKDELKKLGSKLVEEF